MKYLYMFFFTLLLSAPSLAAVCRPVNTVALRNLMSRIVYSTPTDPPTYRDYRGRYTAVTRLAGGRPTVLTERGGYSFHGSNDSYEVSFFRCGPDDDSQCEQITSERWTIEKNCFLVDGIPAVVTRLTSNAFRFTYNRETEAVRDSYALGSAQKLDVISVKTSAERTFVRLFTGTGVE